MEVGLRVKRNDGETWRDAVRRVAGHHGMAAECLACFDRELSLGSDDGEAAWSALYEWDCLEPCVTE